jgi:outer membrane immunogenic protein
VPGSLDLDDNGFSGGVQVGYNVQFNSIVVGLEADINYMGLDEEDSFSGAGIPGLAPDGVTTSAKQELKWLGTVRGRLGFTPTPPLLVYATGGLAFGDVDQEARVTVNGVDGPLWSGDNSETAVGWTIGAGVEYAITANWSAKLEYLYYDLGSQDNSALGNDVVRAIPALDGVDYRNETDTSGSIVRLGVNYRF